MLRRAQGDEGGGGGEHEGIAQHPQCAHRKRTAQRIIMTISHQSTIIIRMTIRSMALSTTTSTLTSARATATANATAIAVVGPKVSQRPMFDLYSCMVPAGGVDDDRRFDPLFCVGIASDLFVGHIRSMSGRIRSNAGPSCRRPGRTQSK